MGGEKARADAAFKQAAQQVAQHVTKEEVKLTPNQAAVVTAFQRITAAIQVEAGQLAQMYGQREAAGELANSAEHLNKYAVRFIAESQRLVIVPTLQVTP